jgi:hypothetical protein
MSKFLPAGALGFTRHASYAGEPAAVKAFLGAGGPDEEGEWGLSKQWASREHRWAVLVFTRVPLIACVPTWSFSIFSGEPQLPPHVTVLILGAWQRRAMVAVSGG